MKAFLPLNELPIVILCGGKSSRMGEDKSLLPFAAYKTLAQYQYERLKPHFKHIYFSSKVNKFDFLEDDDNIIFDDDEIYSPMVALKTILQNIKNQKVFILTVDTPFVKIDTIQQLLLASKNHEITVAKTEKLHNLCGIFDTSILYKIEEALSQDIHKIGYLLKQSHTQEIEFFDENEFLNVNKKEDYLKALSIIS